MEGRFVMENRLFLLYFPGYYEEMKSLEYMMIYRS